MRLTQVCPNFYEYLDFRKLLKDYFEKCRNQSSTFSMRYFAKKLGFQSPNYIQRILVGDRKITEKSMSHFVKLLELDSEEQEYFELLVNVGQAQDMNRRNHYFNQLISIRRKKLKVTTLDESQYVCISSWLHWVIREMSFLEGSIDNVQWVVRYLKMPITPKEVAQCVKDLLNAGLLIGMDGELKAAMSSVNFPEEVYSLALHNYHQQILDQAKIALKVQRAKDREYGAILVATTSDKFQMAKEKIKKFRREILELLDTPDGEATRVVNYSFQLFQVVDEIDSELT